MRLVYIIIAVLLAVNNVFVKFRVGPISYDRLLEILIFFAFFKLYLQEIRTNPFFKKWNMFIWVFGFLQLLVNFKLAIFDGVSFSAVYTDFFKCFSFVVYSFLFVLILKEGKKYLDIFIVINLLICVFALLQHPLSPISSEMLQLKRMLFANADAERLLNKLDTEEAYIEGGYAGRFRLSGPFASAIGFSYFAISSFIINLYMYLRYKSKFYLFATLLVFIASLLTQTRSLVLGELFMVIGFLFFMPTRKKGVYKIGIIASGLVLLFFVISADDFLAGNSRLTQVSSEGQGDSRPLLWTTGIYTVFKYPFGVSKSDYKEAKKDMYFVFGHPAILALSSHHGLINIGFHYSFLGYVVFALFIIFLIRYINGLDSRFSVFFKVALVSYAIHISFHNNIVLTSDYSFLLVLILIWFDQYNFQKDSLNPEEENSNKQLT